MINYDIMLMYNFDKTMIIYKERKLKIITIKEFIKKNQLFKLVDVKEYEHITISLTINVASQMLKLLIIFPHSELSETLVEELAFFFPDF